MSNNNIDFASLGFGYIKTDYRYESHHKDGEWGAGSLVTDGNITISESAAVFQYAQTCFEGLKAYTTVDGRIVTFRPDLNAERMADSCARLVMPVFPKERFIDAVRQVVAANRDFVPPYGSGATLYLRPFMIGSAPVIGVKPSAEYTFRIFCTPVGPYFKGGVRPLRLRVADADRAAPHGTGAVKAGLNYAMSLKPGQDAHAAGYDENMFLDAATHSFVDETGGANFLFVSAEGTVVTPKSDSILPSITRRSLMYVAEHILGLAVEHRPVPFAEVKTFAECGLCGTAAVISPVGSVTGTDGVESVFLATKTASMGPTIKRLYDTLTGIQMGRIPAPEGWIYEI
jgi:branched-chain amino acid aminotransferase